MIFAHDDYQHGVEFGRGVVVGMTAAIEAIEERNERERLLADPGIEGMYARATRDLLVQYNQAMIRIDEILYWSPEQTIAIRDRYGIVYGI